jgi:hypothetical protein
MVPPLLLVLLGGVVSTILAVLRAHRLLSVHRRVEVVARADGPDTGSCAVVGGAAPATAVGERANNASGERGGVHADDNTADAAEKDDAVAESSQPPAKLAEVSCNGATALSLCEDSPIHATIVM